MRFAAFLLMMPGVALAQTTTSANDLEYRDADIEEAPSKLKASGFFEVQWHEFDNLDFRLLDESSDQAILDTDDRTHSAFTGVSLTHSTERASKRSFHKTKSVTSTTATQNSRNSLIS